MLMWLMNMGFGGGGGVADDPNKRHRRLPLLGVG